MKREDRPHRRDPGGRREEILRAAIDVIAENGLGGATHRLIADRANVPLGSTTYYFPTLSDLTASALEFAMARYDDELDDWDEELGTSRDVVSTLVDLTSRYVADQTTAIIEYELYVAAAHEEQLRPIARQWVERLSGIVAPFTSATAAKGITMLVDGAIVEAIALNRPLDTVTLRESIGKLIEPPGRPSVTG